MSMFVQVIQGRIKDAGAFRKALDRWMDELKPGAEGWLGATAGVTDDGEFVSVVRFESEEAARRNSDRPEQTEWWNEFARNVEGEATFIDTSDVDLWQGGGSDDAGFVQIIQARVKDRVRYRKMMEDTQDDMSKARPDVVGGITAWHGDRFTDTVYFTSEAEARKGESQQNEEFQAQMSEWNELVEDMRFTDLRDPIMSSP
jgi:hypothetical protein